MKRRSLLIILLLLVLTAAVIVYALFFMGSYSDTAHVSLPSPGQSSAVSTGEPYSEHAELSASNVQAVLAELERAESYSCTATVEDYWPGGSGTSEMQVWVNEGNVRIRGEDGGVTRNVLLLDGTLYIWADSVGGVFSAPYSGSEDRWLRALTYEDLLNVPTDLITAAGYTKFAGVECISCSYTDPENSYTNVIYVSVASGLLMCAESYDGDEIFYRYTSSVPELSVPDPELFVPPEG